MNHCSILREKREEVMIFTFYITPLFPQSFIFIFYEYFFLILSCFLVVLANEVGRKVWRFNDWYLEASPQL